MRKIVRGLLTAVTACLLSASSSASAFEFGACVHLALARSDAATVLRHLDAAGLTSLRDDVYWSGVERTQGTLQLPPRYDQLKVAIEGMARRSRSALLILDFGNRFYDGGGLVTSPEGIQAFARYAEFVVRSFGDSVKRYEVWNEWNAGFGSKPKVSTGDAGAYVRLLAETSKAIKRANPRAMVIGGATAGVDLKWLRAFINADGLRHVDAVSVHSYTMYRLKESPEGAVNSLDKLHAMLVAAAPDRDIPIYVTEMGWPTNKGKFGVSERDAAKYLIRFMMLVRTRPWIGGVWWYDLIDDGDKHTSAEHRFGLIARDLRLKPAFTAAQRIAPMLLTDARFDAYRSQSGHYVVTGTDDTGQWAMAWAMDKSFLEWADGTTKESAAPAALEALAAQAPADGFPMLYRRTGKEWRLEAEWGKESSPRIAAPTNFKVNRSSGDALPR